MKKLMNFFKKPDKKKIISFDGGGVRAIAGLVFLRKLETEMGAKIFDSFDMFIGTSAGAFNAACFASTVFLLMRLNVTGLKII